MNKKKNFITAFSFVAFIVYVIVVLGSIAPAANDIYAILFTKEPWDTIRLPLVNNIFAVLIFLISLRLYLHSWGTDETFLIFRLRDYFNGFWKISKFLELPIRLAWLFMAAYLPIVFSNLHNELIINCSWTFYLAIIFVLILMWDIMIYFPLVKLYQSENRRHDQIKYFLLIFDVIITILFVIQIFIGKDWGGDYNNWKPFVYLASWSIIGFLSFIQIFNWGYAILKGKIEFRYIS